MSATITVQPSGRQFTVEADETILDAALRNGLAFPYGCRGGACGACGVKVLSGEVEYEGGDPIALSEDDKANNRHYMCAARAAGDLTVEVHEVESAAELKIAQYPAKVARLEKKAEDVMRVWLKLPDTDRMAYLAGQYVDFLLEDGRRRAFSIANPPHDDELLEFHIRHIKGGEFTSHVFDDMHEKEMLRIEGPHGSFYLREDSERPVILLATGTGFGPIKAIMEHAIAEGSKRPFHIYWGARHEAGLYMDEMVRGWAATHDNIHYTPVLSRPAGDWQGRTGHVQDVAAADFDDLSGFEVYACGHPQMVHSAKAALTAKGLDPEHCFSDAFEWASDSK